MPFPSSISIHKMQQPLLFSIFFFFLGFASADYLQNSDFESLPKNVTRNSSVAFVLLNENNTIPGCTFQGTVQYVTAGRTVALPDNGHAIETRVGSQRPDNQGVFSFKQHYGKQAWQSYGQYLGLSGQEESVNLVFESQSVESEDNSTCWPVIDSLLVKVVDKLVQGKDNLLLNGGFESGPEFLSNSTEGILLDSTLSLVESPLRQWAVVGTIRYIDSKHFFVPHGNAAVEIVSGVSAGIHTEVSLSQGSAYNLDFTLGDANNACEGDFIVEVQAGSVVQNFTIRSNGTGSAEKSSIKFKAGSSATPISFSSFTSSQTKDGIFCGPVVDDVVLLSSNSPKIEIKPSILISLLLLIVILWY
ncbi:hypothetical protein V6N11_043721 [Hibiscus sabdariffa]|uniref:DUF642 domain-containing protein n=1 Tax=Hibiscus sabdariffa TaxID=183260 RepID=A0ABR2RDL2_9ROSI